MNILDMKEGTFVIVLPHKGNEKTQKGIIEKVLEDNFLKIRTGRGQADITYVPDRKVIPLFRTEAEKPGDIDNLQLLAWIIENFLPRKEEPEDLPRNMLVVVSPKQGKPAKTCWGLIKRKGIGEKYDVRIGFKRSVFASRDQITSVIETDGSIRGPLAAVKKELEKIILQLILRLHINNEKYSLKFLIQALENL